jgi:hypothetical protein
MDEEVELDLFLNMSVFVILGDKIEHGFIDEARAATLRDLHHPGLYTQTLGRIGFTSVDNAQCFNIDKGDTIYRITLAAMDLPGSYWFANRCVFSSREEAETTLAQAKGRPGGRPEGRVISLKDRVRKAAP